MGWSSPWDFRYPNPSLMARWLPSVRCWNPPFAVGWSHSKKISTQFWAAVLNPLNSPGVLQSRIGIPTSDTFNETWHRGGGVGGGGGWWFLVSAYPPPQEKTSVPCLRYFLSFFVDIPPSFFQLEHLGEFFVGNFMPLFRWVFWNISTNQKSGNRALEEWIDDPGNPSPEGEICCWTSPKVFYSNKESRILEGITCGNLQHCLSMFCGKITPTMTAQGYGPITVDESNSMKPFWDGLITGQFMRNPNVSKDSIGRLMTQSEFVFDKPLQYVAIICIYIYIWIYMTI